jgi:carboxypeptidase PM20D1
MNRPNSMTAMIRFVRWVFVAVALGLIGLVLVVLVQTWAATSVQLAVDPVAKIAIDDEAIARLAGAIRCATISFSDGQNQDPAAFDALHRHLRTSFPRVHTALAPEVIGGHGLLYTWKGKNPSASPILLMGHTDVVPVEPGTETSWSHGPFSGDIADGFVWGRGTLDDKVSVMAILEAVEILLARGYQPDETILLAFGRGCPDRGTLEIARPSLAVCSGRRFGCD